MYLPQFHRTEENDKWWGEGFTDWVAAQNAKKMFANHYQPHVPLDENYYNLLEKDTMIWQSQLMKKYGIDGQCFYHYWFKNGKRILEKPAENLLRWKDVDIPFCFCWANETWAKSWSKFSNVNVWSGSKGVSKENDEERILLEQDYGNENDWEEHFFYLLQFFRDERYIKCDGKPVFLIYRSNLVPCLKEMTERIDVLAKENGFPGIYFICANADRNLPTNIDAVLLHSPQNVIRQFSSQFSADIKRLDYENCWNLILNEPVSDRKTYYEGFCGYDDSPRRGRKGIVVEGSTPTIFTNKMIDMLSKSDSLNNEFVFVNAWNEWGEGMHLEPDEKWGYAFLEGVKTAKTNFKAHQYVHSSLKQDDILRLRNDRDKFEKYLNVLSQWFHLENEGISIENWLKVRGYNRIVLHGYGIFARHLISKLEKTDIDIIAIADKQKERISCEIETILPNELPDSADAVIVTSFFYYNEICKNYVNVTMPVISFENIINEMIINEAESII